VDTQRYKQRLLELEKHLTARMQRETGRAREQKIDSVADAGDESVADQAASQDLTEAELDSIELAEVRDALKRIEDGTFGKCIVDGGPIEPQRLEASPWTPYCLKHQQRREAAAPPRTPTL
jgi:DnaK suppressor protein